MLETLAAIVVPLVVAGLFDVGGAQLQHGIWATAIALAVVLATLLVLSWHRSRDRTRNATHASADDSSDR